MILGPVVDWEKTVLATWRRSASDEHYPNRDVWERLPEGVCWFEGQISADDADRVYLIGSEDWEEVFGTYHLPEVSLPKSGVEDQCRHVQRIQRMRNALAEGWAPLPLVLVATHHDGPYVVIDGNHRIVALHQLTRLAAHRCYVGFHHKLAADFVWYRRAVGTTPAK